MKILIVDDMKEDLYLLESLLKGGGYEVVSAKNGVEALEKLKKDTIDIIISDILMPKMDGFQLCRACKSNDTLRKIPFIFYTATYADKKDEDLALSLGAEKLIVKPEEPGKFLEILESVIKDYRKRPVTAPKKPVMEEAVYLEKYNRRLIKKLEKKMLDLNRELTERKQMVRIVNRSPVVVFLWRAEEGWPVEFVSDNIKQFGYSPEDFYSGRIPYSSIVHPDDLEHVTAKVAKYSSQEDFESFNQEYRIISRTGEVHWLDDRTWIRRDDNGIITHYQGIILDITGRKHAEKALRESEEKYRSIIENTLDVIYSADSDGVLTYVSPQVSILGYAPEEVIGRNLVEFIHPDDVEYVLQDFERTIRTGEKPPTTFRAVKKDGGTLYVEEIGKGITDEDDIVGIIGVIRDVTDRKRAEEARGESEAKYRTLIEQSNDAIYLLAEGKFELINRKFTELLGVTPEEARSPDFNLMDIVAPSSREVIKTRKKLLERGELPPRRYEFMARSKDGREIQLEASVSYIQFEGKQATQGILHDITERKRLEAQLRHAQKMETIGTLAGGIAHDFNNILAPILGYTDIALDQLPPDSQTRGYLVHVLKATHRAKDLVMQILTFSRQNEQERKPVQIHLIVKEALRLIRASLPTTIEIRQNIDTKCETVLADSTQIHQVIMNLCTNAYHAMRESGGIIEVNLGMVEVDTEFARVHLNLHEGTYVELIVSDTGHGMDRATMEQVFEPFFTTKGIGEGTDLGLSVVHGIVMGHGGEITVYSELGKGCKFHVYLPSDESDVEHEVRKDQPIPRGNERVMYVDDEKEIAIMGQQMLERLGYEVTVRTSSVEALEAFRAQPNMFDIVITDQTMPQMTGVQLAWELMQIRPDIPIILMTGFSHTITPERSKELGIRGYIMKPIVARDLSMAIRRVLDQEQNAETKA